MRLICDSEVTRHTPVPGRDNDMSKLNLPPVWQYLNFGGLPEVAPHLTPRRQGCLEFCQNSTNVRQWFEHFTLRMASNPQTGRKWPLWGLGVSKTQIPDKHHDIASRPELISYLVPWFALGSFFVPSSFPLPLVLSSSIMAHESNSVNAIVKDQIYLSK